MVRARSASRRRSERSTRVSTKGWTSARCVATRAANRSTKCGRSRTARSFTPIKVAGASNYGRYVVVEHRWGGCPYYSLYAHLEHDRGQAGERVKQGKNSRSWVIPASGIDRERAHVHVELNLSSTINSRPGTRRFSRTIRTATASTMDSTSPGSISRGSISRGARIRRSTIPAFLNREEVFYKVMIPNSPNFQLPQRYPWMIDRRPNEKPAAWEISFARSGLPLRLTPSDRAVSAPRSFLRQVEPGGCAHYLTRISPGAAAMST